MLVYLLINLLNECFEEEYLVTFWRFQKPSHSKDKGLRHAIGRLTEIIRPELC
jgi:hypothetical protein